MAKFRGLQIRDGAVQTVHLTSGITVNGVTLSGNSLSQKTLGLVDSIGLNGSNVSYNLDNFLPTTGGTVTGTVTVVGGTTVNSSVSVVSGASLGIHGLVSSSDLIQALAGVHTTVTAAALERMTDGSSNNTDHTHNFSAVGGKEEKELVKVATQDSDSIVLNFGNFALLSLPNVSTLKSSDIEAFINGQLLEYGSPNGFTLNSSNGTITFHPAISGDTLAVIWRGLDTTASGVVVSYEPTEYPYPSGGGISTQEGLYSNGGSPGDLYGSWSAPTTSDGRPDIHMKLVVSGVEGISRIDIKKDSTIVASTESGVGVPVRAFTGSINRSFPFTMDSSGAFVFDLYFTTPTGVSAGNLLTATYTPTSGSAVNVQGTGLASSGTAPLPPLSSISDIYANVDKKIADIAITNIVTPFGTVSSFQTSGEVFLSDSGQSLPVLPSYPSWLSSGDLAASDWIKFKIKNYTDSSASYVRLDPVIGLSTASFSFYPSANQKSIGSGIVALSSSGTLLSGDTDVYNSAASGDVTFYARRYLGSDDLLASGKVWLKLYSSYLNGGYYINGKLWGNQFGVAKGATYSNLTSLHFDDPYRVSSLSQPMSPLGSVELATPSCDYATRNKVLSLDLNVVAVSHDTPATRLPSVDLGQNVVSDSAYVMPRISGEFEQTTIDFSSLVV